MKAPKLFNSTYQKMVNGKKVKVKTKSWYAYIGRKKVCLGKDRKAAHIRSGELLKEELRRREFGDLGVIDPFKEAEKISVLEYLDMYHAYLKDRFSENYADEQYSKIDKVIRITKSIYLPEITQPKLLAALNRLNIERDFSDQTFNHYVAAVKAFYNFVDKQLGALRVNPTIGIKKRNVNDATLVHQRRAITHEEAVFLINATKDLNPTQGRVIRHWTGLLFID